ncbi:MAG: uncharacterized protein JWM82_597 [Myxococcales bacterium]|nr:uncharacterized protein [Myxococcales bacterium]
MLECFILDSAAPSASATRAANVGEPYRPKPASLAPKSDFARGSEQPRGVVWFGIRSFWGHLRHLLASAIATEDVDSRDWMTADPPWDLNSRIAEALGGDADGRPLVEALDRDLWLDFVADTGDDVAVSRAVAGLIFADYELPDPDREGSFLRAPRGDILLFGGDTAYPVATAQEITNRVIVPFNQILETLPNGPVRVLLGIPGNHDWYDGLDGFARMFRRTADDEEPVVRGSVVGIRRRGLRSYATWAGQFVRGGEIEKPKALALSGYQPVQSASYFALPLSSRLHLFAVDRQLRTLDPRQVRFFESWRRHHPDVNPLVVMPDPLFAFGKPSATGVAMVEALGLDLGTKPHFLISGDVHHYERVRHRNALHVTAGGGGAFLHPAPLRRHARLRAEVEWPSARQSRALLWQVPFKVMRGNSGFLPHIVLSALFLPAMNIGFHQFPNAGSVIAGAILIAVLTTVIYSLIGRVLRGGVVTFMLSLAAGLSTAAIPVFASFVFVHVAKSVHVKSPLWLIALVTVVVSVFCGALIFGTLLALLTFLGLEETHAFAALDHPGFKHFLRLRVRRDGSAVDLWCLGLTDPLAKESKPELIDVASFRLDQ